MGYAPIAGCSTQNDAYAITAAAGMVSTHHKSESDESILTMDKAVDWAEDPIIEVGTEVLSKPGELLKWRPARWRTAKSLRID